MCLNALFFRMTKKNVSVCKLRIIKTHELQKTVPVAFSYFLWNTHHCTVTWPALFPCFYILTPSSVVDIYSGHRLSSRTGQVTDTSRHDSLYHMGDHRIASEKERIKQFNILLMA